MVFGVCISSLWRLFGVLVSVVDSAHVYIEMER